MEQGIAMAGQDRQSFYNYNLWLEQRGLTKVTMATYQSMFARPAATAQPQPQPQPQPQQEPQPQQGPHLICWLIAGPEVAPPLLGKIKKATCVPLSYMTTFSLAESPRELTATLARRPAATIALLGADGTEELPPEVARHQALWRLPHPAGFAKPGVKAAFWAQLKELMAAVARAPGL